MKIKLQIKRFNPEKDRAPWWGKYEVDVEPNDRLLDALHEVKWRQDGTLAFRRSCAHGVCGSDAMKINGRNRLACKELVRNLSRTIVVEPLMGFRVLKDLIVDMEPFFKKYRQIHPYLVNEDPEEPGRERLQTPAERSRFEDTTKCILCAACTTACPSFWTNPDYVGPASIVQAHRFIFDSRDRAGAERLHILNESEGVWRCRTVFNCAEACPRGIDVPKAIAEVKRALVFKKI
ncbi:MAG: succinate dehydrogenase iron-sulfur subunit [Elusimicrobia bacterium]|nr:succinate dehydrogenase iron-sulfur subunit [Elusimicrobiota bacterium]